jgi:hypothetical protein
VVGQPMHRLHHRMIRLSLEFQDKFYKMDIAIKFYKMDVCLHKERPSLK